MLNRNYNVQRNKECRRLWSANVIAARKTAQKSAANFCLDKSISSRAIDKPTNRPIRKWSVFSCSSTIPRAPSLWILQQCWRLLQQRLYALFPRPRHVQRHVSTLNIDLFASIISNMSIASAFVFFPCYLINMEQVSRKAFSTKPAGGLAKRSLVTASLQTSKLSKKLVSTEINSNITQRYYSGAAPTGDEAPLTKGPQVAEVRPLA